MRVDARRVLFRKFEILLRVLFFSLPSFAVAGSRLSEEESELSYRVRASVLGFRYQIYKTSLLGAGPEINLEKSFGKKWCVSGGFGQSFVFDRKVQSIATSLDLTLWYSLLGKYTQLNKLWRDDEFVFANYTENKAGGLRFGLGTQQIFFKNSSNSIEFSGFSGKILYELGLDFFFDFGAFVDVAKLNSQSFELQSIRSGFTAIRIF